MTQVLESLGQLDSLISSISTLVANAEYQPVLQEFQQVIATGEVGDFSGQHEPNGSGWAPLAASTERQKGNSTILFKTGALEASLVSPGVSGNISSVDSRSLLFGTAIDYAIFLDQGTGRMPPRALIGISEEMLQRLVDQVADSTIEQLRAEFH